MATGVLSLLLSALLVASAKAGTTNPEGGVRVADGHQAGVGQFPHQALIISDGKLVCGGSLVAATAVLTSAHCTVGYKTWSIRLGGIYRTKDEPTEWIMQSIWEETHPQFNVSAYNSDSVAIVFLPEEAPLNIFINLVPLPSFLEVNDSFAGQHALISGWGLTTPTSGYSEILLWTEVTVVPNPICTQFYEPGAIIGSTLCAGNKYTGMCSGDHGSPLVLKTDGGYKQIGVASFLMGNACGTPGVPAAYTRVTSVLDWITSTANISAQ